MTGIATRAPRPPAWPRWWRGRRAVIRWAATAAVFALVSSIGRAEERDPSRPDDVSPLVWPIIKQKCLDCHNAKKQQGGLDMSSLAAMLEGGSSGPALVPGNVEKSLLIELVEFDEMPPRKQRENRVTPAELKRLRQWVEAVKPPAS